MERPPITDETVLLAIMRAAPATRIVTYTRDDSSVTGQSAAVWECSEDHPTDPVHFLGWIADEGSARALLNRASAAACAEDGATFHELPLRYGPLCSMWTLPEHPRAAIMSEAAA